MGSCWCCSGRSSVAESAVMIRKQWRYWKWHVTNANDTHDASKTDPMIKQKQKCWWRTTPLAVLAPFLICCRTEESHSAAHINSSRQKRADDQESRVKVVQKLWRVVKFSWVMILTSWRCNKNFGIRNTSWYILSVVVTCHWDAWLVVREEQEKKKNDYLQSLFALLPLHALRKRQIKKKKKKKKGKTPA